VSLSGSGNGFARKHVYAVHTVLAGCSLLGRRAEAIKTCRDTDVLQADLRQVLNELCLRQSTSNSTGPKIDITAGILGEFDIQGNIGQVKATSRLQHPDNLTKAEFLLRD
jgi:hypothetical protein